MAMSKTLLLVHYLYKEGKNKDCGSKAQYEPQSIEQADELFNLGVLDNNIGA